MDWQCQMKAVTHFVRSSICLAHIHFLIHHLYDNLSVPSACLVQETHVHPLMSCRNIGSVGSKLTSFLFFLVSLLSQCLHHSGEEDRPANIMSILASTVPVNTANSISKCVFWSPKPLHVPPLCLHIAPSFLICHGDICVG